MKSHRVILFLVLLVLLFSFLGGFVYSQDEAGISSVSVPERRLLDELGFYRQLSIILFILLLFSIASNVFTAIVLRRLDHRYDDSLEALRHIDVLRETAMRIALTKSRPEDELARINEERSGDRGKEQ